MSQDQQTYQRAAAAALIGLIAQLVLSVLLALLGLYAESKAFHAATWHFFGGLPIWVMLWVLYHQHRLERAEALEAEQLARADARTAAIFDEAGEQLRVARKRLDNLYRFGLPAVSALVGLYLLGAGGTLLWLNYQLYGAGTLLHASLRADASAGVVTILAVAIAFVAFLVARYVSGMTQVRDWQVLRGGASYLTGNFAVAILLAVAGFFALMDNRAILAALALVVPAVMVVLGVEMFLGLLLGIYRPRRPGEVVRPAFDSRILGWLTRPESLGKIISETLNYQFGFEVSRSWFYRLLAGAVTPLFIVGTLVLIGLSSLVIVAPHQQAVITRFGAFDRVVEPGAHWKLPWPLGRAEKHDVYRIQEVSVGSIQGDLKPGVAILWTNEHTQQAEEYLLTAPTPLGGDDLGADFISGELVGAEVVVKYRIADLERYVKSAVAPEQILEDLAARRVTMFFVTRTIDSMLTADQQEVGEHLRRQIQDDADAVDDGEGLGLEIVFVGVVGVHPPQASEVASKFHEQVGALQKRQSMVQEAQKEAISTLAEVAGSPERARQVRSAIRELERLQRQLEALRGAQDYDADDATALSQKITEQEVAIEELMDDAGGRAAQLIHEARAYRWAQASTERARAERFASQLQAYRNAPQYYKMRQYLQTLAQGLAERRKIIVASEQKQPATIRLNLETTESGLDSILGTE